MTESNAKTGAKAKPRARVATARQIEINTIYHELKCNTSATARHFKISRRGVRNSLLGGEINGLIVNPDKSSIVAPPGWQSRKRTVQYNSKGITQVWDKLIPKDVSIEMFIESIKSRKIPVFPHKIPAPEPEKIQKDMAFVWVCPDIHVGLAAWKPDTLDSNFNLKISKKLEDAATIEQLKKVGYVEHIHIAFLGDLTHTDNKTNMTPAGNNILDVDSRYQKIIWTARDIICNKIEKSLMYAQTVSVDIVKGNHDPNTAVGMLLVLDSYYRDEPRIKINTSPAQFKFFHWGSSFIMFCHGNEAPTGRLGAYLMDYVIQNSIGAKGLFVYKGHIHRSKKEVVIGAEESDGGVCVETFPTLTAKDSWTAGKAFTSRKANIGKLFHKLHGLIDEKRVCVKFLDFKYNITKKDKKDKK